MLKFIFAVLIAFVSGCHSAPIDRTVAFDERQYEPFNHQGTGGIDAQVLVVTDSGAAKVAAGQEIVCTPVTPYSTEFFEKSVLSGKNLRDPWDPAVGKYFSRKIADADGRVKFRNLPAGEWYVWGNVMWKGYDANKYVGVYDYEMGAVAYAKVMVRDGQVTEAVARR